MSDRVDLFAFKLAKEFPDWTSDQCWLAAERIVGHAAAMAFEQSVQADLDALPVVDAA